MSCQGSVWSVAALVVLSVGACTQEESAAASQSEAPQDPSKAKTASSEPSQFTRFVPVGDDEGRFETAITTYRSPGGALVSLIAAVHIADAAHYRELQTDFESYDVVLYELVADPSDRPSPEGRDRARESLLGMFQLMLKSGLELEFQLHAIDYRPDNFVHADLTPSAFLAQMEEKGESFLTIFLRLMSQEMARQKKLRDEEDSEEPAEEKSESQAVFDLVAAFRRREGRHTMRLMVAKQLEQIETMVSGGGGEGSVLLEGRNERALEVLEEQMGQGHKKLAIYYGAAHMPGIERSLLGDLGFEKVQERWLVAWDITKRLDPVRKRKR